MPALSPHRSGPGAHVRVETAVVDIAVPAADREARIHLAGFRGRADDHVEFQVVPHPAVTVFIDLGDALLTCDGTGARRQGSVVVGLASGGVRTGGRGDEVDLVQVRLSPIDAHAVFGTHLGSTGAVALEDLWGRQAGRLLEQLHTAASWDERFGLVRWALARRRDERPAVDREVRLIWEQMLRSRGRARVEQLADEVGWSRKRLWSRFRSQVGLSPKRAASLVRFDAAARRLALGHNIADVATECGYADQSHLSREVAAFSGATPATLAAAPWLAIETVAWPQSTRSPRR